MAASLRSIIMIEPFKTWGMFATPEDRKALDAYVASFNGSERVVATVVMGMTWNFAVELFNKRLEEQDNE
tara:strand:+ start:325 stop:534 length:210 start_codon:yes stop_codon:yes gene_type:complete